MEMRRTKRIISAILAAAISLTVFPTAFAQSESDEALIAELSADTEVYPEGAFAFYESQITASESDGKVYMDVVRRGGTDTEASVGFKAIDVSAVYGKDYTITVKKNHFLSENLDADEDSVPLMQMFAETEGASDAVIGESPEEITPDNIVSVALNADNGDISVEQIRNDNVSETVSEETEEQTSDEAAAEVTDDSLLKAARTAQLGVKSDRVSWKELTGNESQEAAELSEAVSESQEYFDKIAEKFPGAECRLEFAPGEYKKTIEVDIINDDIAESDEQILFMLFDAAGSEMAKPSTAYINIKDSGNAESVVFAMKDSEVIVTADDEYAALTVERTSGIDQFASVTIGTGDITAKPDIDYTAGSVEVFFPQGVNERTVKIPLKGTKHENAVHFAAAIDTSKANADENRSSTAITILPDDSEETAALYAAERENMLKSAKMAENDIESAEEDENIFDENIPDKNVSDEDVSAELMADTTQESIKVDTGNVSSSNTNWSGWKTVARNIDFRNAQSVTINFEASGSYSYNENYKDGCDTKTRTITDYSKIIQVNADGDWSSEYETANANYSQSVTLTKMHGSENGTLDIRVKRKNSKGNGIVYAKIKSVEIVYRNITVVMDNTEGDNNRYIEKLYNVNGKKVDSATGMKYNDANSIVLGQGLVNGQTASAQYKKYSEPINASIITSDKTLTSYRVEPAIGINFDLQGYQYIQNNNTWSSDIIKPNNMNFKTLINKLGKKDSYTIRPVFKVKESTVTFRNSNSDKVEYTNNIKRNDSKVFRYLDTVDVTGIGAGNPPKYSVDNISCTAGTAVERNSADPNRLIIKPNKPKITTDLFYSEPKITVGYNPLMKNDKNKEQGDVFYWDESDAANSKSGNYNTPMEISPVTINGSYNINAVYSDSDEGTRSKYTTVWQDFTGDKIVSNKLGDGNLSTQERSDVEIYELNRAPVTSDIYTYKPKAVNSMIYYYFKEKHNGDLPGIVEGVVKLKDKPIFGGKETITPLNGAAVTIDGETVTTQYDAVRGGMRGRGGDGYFGREDATFAPGEGRVVNVIYGPLSASTVHWVNIAGGTKDYVLDAYDTISVQPGATISKNNNEIGIENLFNDDADYTVYFATESDISAVVAQKAVLTFYRADGSYITEQTYNSTGTNNGIFKCTFNPAKLKLPPGTAVKVKFIDNYGKTYFEHDTGLMMKQSLGAVSLVASFAGKAQPAVAVIGTISSAFNFGWDGNLDDAEGNKELLDGKANVNASIKNTEDTKVLNFGFTFEDDNDGEDDEDKEENEGENTKDKIKDTAKNGTEDEKSEAVKDSVDDNNKTKGELAVGYNVEFNFALSLTLKLDTEEGSTKKGTWYFEEFMLAVGAGAGVEAEYTYVTPIGIPIIVGAGIGAEGEAIFVVERRIDSPKFYMAQLSLDDNGSMDLINAGKNEMKDFVYMYGDFKIAPWISLKAGVGVDQFKIELEGKAAFDFNFSTKNEDSGDVTFTCALNIKILIFEKSWTLANETVDLFESGPQLYDSLDEFKVSTREHLAKRTEWNGEVQAELAAVADTAGLKESTIMDGVNPNLEIEMLPFGDGKYIAVFTDDVPSRSDENSTAVYYTIYNNGEWSKPIIIEDDGTVDDSPAMHDLENGKIFITWSTADKEFGKDPNMLETLNSRNIHGVFFDTESQKFSGVIEVTKTTNEDAAGDVDSKTAYDPETGKMLIYYTKTEYSATDNEEGVYGDAVYPYTLIAYRKFDVHSMAFDDYSAEEEAEIRKNLADSIPEGGDIDAAFEEYKEDFYNQRFLGLAPRVIVSENINDMGFADSAPVITEYTENDPLVVESDVISYNGLSLFAYVLDYDGNKSTTNDRDIFMQIYNFEEDSVVHTMMVTADDVQDGNLKFERIGGAVTYLAYLSDGNIKMFNISDNMSNDDVTQEGTTEDGTKYYYLVKTPEAKYIPPIAAVSGEESGDHSGERTITDFSIHSGDKYFYIMFTENNMALKDGIEYGSEESALAENNLVETQIMMTRYDIDNDVLTKPIQVTNEAGANYSNAAFAVEENGFMALAEKSMSSVKTINEVEISAEDSDNSSLCSIQFKPESVLTIKNPAIENIVSGEYAAGSFELYNEGFETINGIIIEVKDSKGNVITNNIANIDEKSEYSLDGGYSELINVGIPLDKNENSCGFTVTAKSADGVQLAQLEYSDEVPRIADVNLFEADITERGKIEFTADVINNQTVATGEQTFEIKAGDEVIYTVPVESLDFGQSITLSDEIEIDYDKLFKSVTNEDGSVEAKAGLTASVSNNGESKTAELMLYASADEMKAMNALKDVSIAGGKDKVTVKVGNKINLNTLIEKNNESIDDSYFKVSYISDNEDAAVVYPDGGIEGISEGTAKITAMVMPRNGVSDSDELELKYPTLPEEAFKLMTVDVEVKKSSSGGGSSGGGSSKGSKATAAPAAATPLAMPTSAPSDEPSMPVKTDTPHDSNEESVKYINIALEKYTDIVTGAWYAESVGYISEKGIMTGVSDNTFAPNDSITRAMLAAVLFRISGDDVVSGGTEFADAEAGSWYENAVKWGSANGIIQGIGDNMFAPNDIVTREQICTMIKRYMNYKNITLEETAAEMQFSDESEISDYAVEYVNELQRCGIISGRDTGEFDPKGSAARAECAAIIARFMIAAGI